VRGSLEYWRLFEIMVWDLVEELCTNCVPDTGEADQRV